MAVLDGHHPVAHPVVERLLDGRGHGAGGFPGSHDDEPSSIWQLDPGEGAQDEGTDVARGEARVEDGAGGGARGHRASFCSRRPASISMSSVLGKQKRIVGRSSLNSRYFEPVPRPEAALDCTSRQYT